MKRPLLLSFILSGLLGSAHAQLPVFAKSSASYSYQTGGIRVAKDSVWDDVANWSATDKKFAIGFKFGAFGWKLDSFNWEDGAVSWKKKDTTVHIGGYGDFVDRGFGSKNAKSPIRMVYTGTSGSRIVKLQWQNFGFFEDWNANGICGDSGNMQLWIYESEPKIELRFGPSSIPNFSSIYPEKFPFICAKFDGGGNTSGIELDGAQGNPSAFPFASGGSSHGLTGWPSNGTLYTFTFSAAGVKTTTNSGTFYVSGNKILNYGPELSASADIFTADGRLVQSGVTGIYGMDLSSLAAGVYVAKMKMGDQTGTLKFIIP